MAVPVRAAEETKFVARIDGKPVQRDYTFMEREIAKQSRLGETRVQSMEALQEEAVAEMFRAHLDGRMKLKGQPAGLLRRIMNFLKGIVGANRSAGFTKADQIFQRIEEGEIGARNPTQNRGGGRASSFISGTFDTANLNSILNLRATFGARSSARPVQPNGRLSFPRCRGSRRPRYSGPASTSGLIRRPATG